MWSGGLPRKFELPRSASFGLTGFRDGVGAMEGKLFADKVSKFARQISDVALVDVCESEFVDDGKKETDGADGHEGVRIVGAKDTSCGTE